MRILVDEDLDVRLRLHFGEEHTAVSVQYPRYWGQLSKMDTPLTKLEPLPPALSQPLETTCWVAGSIRVRTAQRLERRRHEFSPTWQEFEPDFRGSSSRIE